MGGVVRLRLAPSYFAFTGAALHHFFNGSGTTIGIPLGIGREIRILEKFTIPVEFRTNLIFGDATIGFGGGIGLMFQLKK